eukprot:gene39882-12041_t
MGRAAVGTDARVTGAAAAPAAAMAVAAAVAGATAAVEMGVVTAAAMEDSVAHIDEMRAR